jgi:hypothetical protein
MKQKLLIPLLLIASFAITLVVGSHSFRLNKVPNSSKFSCNTCHTNGGGTPRNPFGQEVETRVTPGGMETFWGPELAALDSDGDGFTNGEELQDPNGEWMEGMAQPGDISLVTAPGDSNSKPSATSVTDLFGNPAIYELHGNYPNPFNPSTNIQFTIPQPGNVKIDIYNINGELVSSLTNKDFAIGTHSVTWNGKDNSGSSVSSGIYLYRMTSNNFVQSNRMLLLK